MEDNDLDFTPMEMEVDDDLDFTSMERMDQDDQENQDNQDNPYGQGGQVLSTLKEMESLENEVVDKTEFSKLIGNDSNIPIWKPWGNENDDLTPDKVSDKYVFICLCV